MLVEDVVTTGKSSGEAIAVAREQGAEVVAVGAILDRSGGEHPFTMPFHALHALRLPTWSEADCPLCRDGGRAEKPGSRSS